MVAKFCSRSHGQPVFGVRSAAMMASRRSISREGIIGGSRKFARTVSDRPQREEHDAKAIQHLFSPDSFSSLGPNAGQSSNSRLASNRNQVRRSVPSMKF